MQKKVKRSFRNVADKKKHLLSLCRFEKCPKEGLGNAACLCLQIIRCAHTLPTIVQEAQAREAQPKMRRAVLLRAAALAKDQRFQMPTRLTICPRNVKLEVALSP